MSAYAVAVTTDRPGVLDSGSLPFLIRHVHPKPGEELVVRFETSMMITLAEPLFLEAPTRFEVEPDISVMISIGGSDFPHIVAHDHLTCINLRFSGGGAWNSTGGGVHIRGAQSVATFEGCQFYNCYSASESGAISAKRIQSLDVRDCVFSYNCSTQEGGALFTSCRTHIVDSIFTNNTALMRGGAIYVAEGSETTLQNCVLRENKSPLGANLYASGTAMLVGDTQV